MAQGSGIEWTESTWNPVTGCSKISPGCKHCYAERMAERLQPMGLGGKSKKQTGRILEGRTSGSPRSMPQGARTVLLQADPYTECFSFDAAARAADHHVNRRFVAA
jgi:protein gp37